MSNVNVLVKRFLTHTALIKWVNTISASVVDHCFKLPSWHWWMKFFEITWNWSLLPITFSMSFPIVFKRTIGQNILGESLLDLGMMIEDNILKYGSQYPKLIHVLVMLTRLFRHMSSLTIALRYFQNNLSSSRVNRLLHLAIVLLNSLNEKGLQIIVSLVESSSNIFRLTCQSCTKLNDWYNTSHKSLRSIHGWLLCWIASITGSLHFFTQFMSFQKLWFLEAISWILSSKNTCLISFIAFLNYFQSLTCLDDLYFVSFILQKLFHHSLECFVILMSFKCLNQIWSVISVNS